jgi:phosphoadenosine phosphosulfate reductase
VVIQVEPAAAPLPEPERVEPMSAEEVLAFVAERFGDRLMVACSFQKESSVIIDMLASVAPRTRLFTLDTGLFFPETYATWRALEERYGVRVEAFQGMTLARQAAVHGDELWRRDSDACCEIRRVSPLEEALAGADAWVSGVRREQSRSRAGTAKVAWDSRYGLWKANPLADWSERDVWTYLAERDVPYNELHDRGYGSIGCTHCTVPGAGREGRWAGSAKTECGLH